MRLLLLVAAVVMFIVLALMGFDAISADHATGFLGVGLACFAAASIPWPDRP